MKIIGPEAAAHLDWLALTEALIAGHRLPRAQIGDTFLYRDGLYRGGDTLLSRAAWIDGLGAAVKSCTILPGNPDRGRPMINGTVTLFDDATGAPEALLDFHLVTRWKTAGDSLLAARLLARPESRDILVVGAGTVAGAMVEAYRAAFPQARVRIWARRLEQAEALAAATGAEAVADLAAAVGGSDIIATTTMASDPVIRGDWLRPGTHLDLIGAYRPDMREVDDVAIARARVFVNSRATTIRHIGELMIPIATGVLREGDVVADYYDIAAGLFRRGASDEITIAKNGGGAHLDLMTARYILGAVGGP